MITRTRKFAASLFATTLLAAGALVPTAAAQVEQDGLVNVNVGDVTILENVQVGAIVNVVAAICPNVNAGVNVAVLAGLVDNGTVRQAAVCRADLGRVTLTQNQEN